VLKAIGSAGGELVLWNTNTFQLISSLSGGFSIIRFLQMNSSFSWAFTGIYGPHVRADKLRMLEVLEMGGLTPGA